MNDRVVVVDDENSNQRLLKVCLSSHGYEVVSAITGHDALVLTAQWQPCFVLLDLGLPDMDGIEVLKRLREWYENPILILSVRSDEEQIVAGLDAGANDYVTKPFNTSELLARIRASLRSQSPQKEAVKDFQASHLRVDFITRQVFVKEQEIKLTAIQYEVLRYFIQHAGRTITHKQILKAVWGPNAAHQNQYRSRYNHR